MDIGIPVSDTSIDDNNTLALSNGSELIVNKTIGPVLSGQDEVAPLGSLLGHRENRENDHTTRSSSRNASEPLTPGFPDTLHFSPPISSFLDPYLPPISTTSVTNVPLLPHITLTYATSLDSQLSFSPTIPTLISGPATKAMTHYLRAHHSAILIGVGTALADNPTLNCRLSGAGGYGGSGRDLQPQPVIVDPNARWRLDEGTEERRVLKAAKQGQGKAPWVIVSKGFEVEESRLEALKAIGGRYLWLDEVDTNGRLRWEGVFLALAREGVHSVMVEGGGMVINDLLRPEYANLVASVVVTVAPTYLGLGGVTVCPARMVDAAGKVAPAVRFRDVRWQPLGEDVVMCGRLSGEGLESSGEENKTLVT